MKHALIALSSLGVLAGCPGNDTLNLTISRQGDPAALQVTDTINGKDYAVSLSEGQILIGELKFSDGVDEVVALNQETFDFVAESDLVFGVEDFNLNQQNTQAIVTPANDPDGVALRLSGVVTLTDATEVNFTALVPAPGDSQEFAVNISVSAGLFFSRALFEDITLDLATLLTDIDFDTLGAGGADITIAEGSEDAEIDAALLTLQANLLTAFQELIFEE